MTDDQLKQLIAALDRLQGAVADFGGTILLATTWIVLAMSCQTAATIVK